MLMIRLEWRYLRFLSAPTVLRRLRRSHGRFTQRITGVGWAWDPKPRHTGSTIFQRLYGPGVITYELGVDDQIRATTIRRDGSEHQTRGSRPRSTRRRNG
jgi:hypothetical protein